MNLQWIYDRTHRNPHNKNNRFFQDVVDFWNHSNYLWILRYHICWSYNNNMLFMNKSQFNTRLSTWKRTPRRVVTYDDATVSRNLILLMASSWAVAVMRNNLESRFIRFQWHFTRKCNLPLELENKRVNKMCVPGKCKCIIYWDMIKRGEIKYFFFLNKRYSAPSSLLQLKHWLCVVSGDSVDIPLIGIRP